MTAGYIIRFIHKVEACIQGIWRNGNDSQCQIPSYSSICCLITKRTHLGLGHNNRGKHFTQQGSWDPSTKPPPQSTSSLWEMKKGHGHQLTLMSSFRLSGEWPTQTHTYLYMYTTLYTSAEFGPYWCPLWSGSLKYRAIKLGLQCTLYYTLLVTCWVYRLCCGRSSQLRMVLTRNWNGTDLRHLKCNCFQ